MQHCRNGLGCEFAESSFPSNYSATKTRPPRHEHTSHMKYSTLPWTTSSHIIPPCANSSSSLPTISKDLLSRILPARTPTKSWLYSWDVLRQISLVGLNE